MRLVILESPYAGDALQPTELNVFYAQHCLSDALHRGESPYASHLLYTQPNILDDKNPAERKLGMEAGFAWRKHADVTVVYTDLGITKGMRAGIQRAEEMHTVEYRQLPESFWTRSCAHPVDDEGHRRCVLEHLLRQFHKLYAIARSDLGKLLVSVSPGPWHYPWPEPQGMGDNCGPVTPSLFEIRGVKFAAGPTPDEPTAFHSGRTRFWVRCVTCCEAANADLLFLHPATTSVQAQVMSHGHEVHGWMRG